MVWAGGELGTTGGELGTKGAGLLTAGGDTGGVASTEGNLIGLLGSRAWVRGGSSCATNVSFNLLQEKIRIAFCSDIVLFGYHYIQI